MTRKIASFRDVIDLWPSRAEMARELGLRCSNPPAKVRMWYARNRIRPGYFPRVVSAAERCGFRGVTYALLTSLHKAAKAAKET